MHLFCCVSIAYSVPTINNPMINNKEEHCYDVLKKFRLQPIRSVIIVQLGTIQQKIKNHVVSHEVETIDGPQLHARAPTRKPAFLFLSRVKLRLSAARNGLLICAFSGALGHLHSSHTVRSFTAVRALSSFIKVTWRWAITI